MDYPSFKSYVDCLFSQPTERFEGIRNRINDAIKTMNTKDPAEIAFAVSFNLNMEYMALYHEWLMQSLEASGLFAKDCQDKDKETDTHKNG